MVTNKTVWIVLVISVLLLGVSLLISMNVSDSDENETPPSLEGSPQGNLNLVIESPPEGRGGVENG